MLWSVFLYTLYFLSASFFYIRVEGRHKVFPWWLEIIVKKKKRAKKILPRVFRSEVDGCVIAVKQLA